MDAFRLLTVGAPEGAGERVVEDLRAAGWMVHWSAASGRSELARLLRTPLDLVLVWEGARDMEPGAILELVRGSARRVPVALVDSAEQGEEALELVRRGLSAVVSVERPAQLAALARRLVAEGRVEEVITLVRATCHDLNNQLAVIPLVSHSLQSRVVDASDRRLVDRIESSAREATSSVEFIYRAALWSQGAEDTVPGGVALRHLIEAVAGRLRATLSSGQVETEYPPDLGRVTSSPRDLRQILLCLALDAADVCNDSPALRVVARHHPDGRRVTLAVSATAAEALMGEPSAITSLQGVLETVGGELQCSRSKRGVSYLLTLPLAPSRVG